MSIIENSVNAYEQWRSKSLETKIRNVPLLQHACLPKAKELVYPETLSPLEVTAVRNMAEILSLDRYGLNGVQPKDEVYKLCGVKRELNGWIYFSQLTPGLERTLIFASHFEPIGKEEQLLLDNCGSLSDGKWFSVAKRPNKGTLRGWVAQENGRLSYDEIQLTGFSAAVAHHESRHTYGLTLFNEPWLMVNPNELSRAEIKRLETGSGYDEVNFDNIVQTIREDEIQGFMWGIPNGDHTRTILCKDLTKPID